MPIIKSAIKRMRQTIKRRARNISTRRDLRSAMKAFEADHSAAKLSKAQSEIDKAVKKNLMSKNTAARRKAQLVKTAKEAGVKHHKTTKKTPAEKTKDKQATVEKTSVKKTATKEPAIKKAEE